MKKRIDAYKGITDKIIAALEAGKRSLLEQREVTVREMLSG